VVDKLAIGLTVHRTGGNANLQLRVAELHASRNLCRPGAGLGAYGEEKNTWRQHLEQPAWHPATHSQFFLLFNGACRAALKNVKHSQTFSLNKKGFKIKKNLALTNLQIESFF
jgi:hypothetical protein